MNRIRQPSPALIVAVLTLVAALAGTAVAGPDVTASAVSKKKVKKIATKQINKLAPGLSVANADAVGGVPANQLIRAASDADTNALNGPAAINGPVLETTIEAPRTGHLQITASSDISRTLPDQGIACSISVDGNQIVASRRVLLGDTGEVAKDNIENCATNASLPVSTGSHSVRLDFEGVDTDATVNRRTLDVLFVPFGANGG